MQYFGWFMVLNATFSNISVISWWSVLLMEKTGSTRRKPPTCHKPATNFISLLHIISKHIFANHKMLGFFFYQISSKAAYIAAPFKNKILKSFKLIPNDFIFFLQMLVSTCRQDIQMTKDS